MENRFMCTYMLISDMRRQLWIKQKEKPEEETRKEEKR